MDYEDIHWVSLAQDMIKWQSLVLHYNFSTVCI